MLPLDDLPGAFLVLFLAVLFFAALLFAVFFAVAMAIDPFLGLRASSCDRAGPVGTAAVVEEEEEGAAVEEVAVAAAREMAVARWSWGLPHAVRSTIRSRDYRRTPRLHKVDIGRRRREGLDEPLGLRSRPGSARTRSGTTSPCGSR